MEKLTYKKQKEMVEYSIKSGIPFEEILLKNGLDYNSLVYSDEAKIQDYSFPNFIPLFSIRLKAPFATILP